MEVWKEIENYPLYEVSNYGRVRSWNKKGGGIRDIPKILKQQENTHGYKILCLYNDSNQKTISVSRLVGFNHVDGYKDGLEINHIDGNKENNHASNLEWCTRSHNMKHAIEMGLAVRDGMSGSENGMSTLSESDVLQMRSVYEQGWATHQEIADAWQISRRHAGNIIQRKRWAHL